MDKLVIALNAIFILFYILFFFVVQYGLGWPGKKDKSKTQYLFKKLIFGTMGHLKNKALLRSTKINLT